VTAWNREWPISEFEVAQDYVLGIFSRPHGTQFGESSSHADSLAPEVRLLGHAGRNRPSFVTCKGAEVLVVAKKFARNHWKNVPQGLKPSPIAYSTARLKPFARPVSFLQPLKPSPIAYYERVLPQPVSLGHKVWELRFASREAMLILYRHPLKV
jgi:hypothetical protein